MDKRIIGFILMTMLFTVACHNIFNKDKRKANAHASTSHDARPRPVTPNADSTSNHKADSNLTRVYLTFDDGPEAGTLNCYRTCQDKGVKATFFLIGEHAFYPQGKRILDTMQADLRHFLLANHSFTHASHNQYKKFYNQPLAALSDFQRNQDSLRYPLNIVRFPANNSWVLDHKKRTTELTRPLARLMDSIGYTVLGWDVEWRFNKQSEPVQSAEQIAAEVIAAVESGETMVRNHVVLLAHDRMFRKAQHRDSLSRAITLLQERKGYIFETAADYPQLKKPPAHMLAAN